LADKKQKQPKQLMVTLEPFAVATKDGIPRVITPDTPLWSNDPIVKKYPKSFEPLADQVARGAPVVHTATAVPGEVRAAELAVNPVKSEARSACDLGEECDCE
jgi:hypothetical protein